MEEKTLFNATVCFPVKDGKVLLGMKTDKIGAGCWNGYGGGIEEYETIEQAAVRELQEEVGLEVKEKDLEKIAVIDFHNIKTDEVRFVCRVHFFKTSVWNGKPKEVSGEVMVTPTFFNINNLPLGDMMLADRQFVPHILKGKKIEGEAWYGPYQKELLDIKVSEVTKLSG